MADNGVARLPLMGLRPQDGDGWNWRAAERELAARVPPRARLQAAELAWRTWQARHGYGPGQGPTVAEMMEWIWTPQTATAFILLTAALCLFLCCWLSHKMGEWICTVVVGFAAISLMTVVLVVFLSQWM